jgi:hypothetical protein
VSLNLYKLTFVQLFWLNLSMFGHSGRAFGDGFLSRFVQVCTLSGVGVDCELYSYSNTLRGGVYGGLSVLWQ